MAGRVKIDDSAIAEYFATEVARDMERRAERIKEGAQLRCPVDTGRLRESIDTERDDVRDNISFVVGTPVDYADDVELGTGPHEITAAPGKMLRWVDRDGSVHFAHSVHHPGTRAQPYLRPALLDGA